MDWWWNFRIPFRPNNGFGKGVHYFFPQDLTRRETTRNLGLAFGFTKILAHFFLTFPGSLTFPFLGKIGPGYWFPFFLGFGTFLGGGIRGPGSQNKFHL